MEVAITWTEKILTTPDQVDTNGTDITRGAIIIIDPDVYKRQIKTH